MTDLREQHTAAEIDRIVAGVRPRDRWIGRALAAISILAATVAGVGFASILLADDPPWDPLGEFDNPQIVQGPRRDGVPVVDLDAGAVKMTGTKCYGPEPVTVAGELSWRSVDPRGTASRTQDFPPAEFGPGCATVTFTNPIPDIVRAATCDRGIPTRWTVGGLDVPVDGSRRGVSRDWWSEPFDVDPRGAAACGSKS